MAREKNEANGTATEAKQGGKYTILLAQSVTLTQNVTDENPDGEQVTAEAYTVVGEVEARSKNDALRKGFNSNLISGAGKYAAVTSRSFAPITIEPKQRTTLSWS